MKDLEARAEQIVRRVVDDFYIEDDDARASLVSWRKFLTHPVAGSILLIGTVIGIAVGAWVAIGVGGGFEENVSAWWIAPVLGACLLTVASMIFAIGSAIEGFAAQLMFAWFGKRKGSVPMQQIRATVARSARKIRRIKQRETSLKDVNDKLKLAHKVAATEDRAFKYVEAQVATCSGRVSVEGFLTDNYRHEEILQQLPSDERLTTIQAAKTVKDCRMEVARLAVALDVLADLEEEQEEVRREKRAAEKNLREVQRQRAFIEKQRALFDETPELNVADLVEDVTARSQRVLAEKEAVRDLQRLAE